MFACIAIELTAHAAFQRRNHPHLPMETHADVKVGLEQPPRKPERFSSRQLKKKGRASRIAVQAESTVENRSRKRSVLGMRKLRLGATQTTR